MKPNFFESSYRSVQAGAETMDKDIFRTNYGGVNDVLRARHNQYSDIDFAEVMGFASVPLPDNPFSMLIPSGA